MHRLYLTGLVSLSLLLAIVNARAAVIYEQLPGGQALAYVSSTVNPLSPINRTADDFALGADATITDVHWWGFSQAGGDNFQITFYSDNAGSPGSILDTSGVSSLSKTPVSVGNFDGDFYSADLISPFGASGGTTYWISVFNQRFDAWWFWIGANPSAGGDGGKMGVDPGPPWATPTGDLAFQLTGAASVPEPGSIALLAAALAGVAFTRRRRLN
jgi:hypothetical protein